MKMGVFILKYRHIAPNTAPQTIGSLNNLVRFLSPLIIQMPNVKEKIAIIANMIMA